MKKLFKIFWFNLKKMVHHNKVDDNGEIKNKESKCEVQIREQKFVDEEIIRNYSSCTNLHYKSETLRLAAKRMEKMIVEKKLYLDPKLSLTRLSVAVGVNRTYMSNILRLKRGFRYYINSFRLKYFSEVLENWIKANVQNFSEETNILEDEGVVRIPNRELTFLVLQSGFSDIRTFKRSLQEIDNADSQNIKQRIYLPLQELEVEQKQQLYRKD